MWSEMPNNSQKITNFAVAKNKKHPMDRKTKTLVIINPISGTGSKNDMPALVAGTLDNDRWDVTIRFTQYPGHATQMAREAVESGTQIVVAIGGDGTINEVAAALAGTTAALGIVPSGSGNGFGRHLHIPTQPAEALSIINQGYIEQVDYCKVNNRPFFCTCGAGFDAQVSSSFAEAGSRGMVTYIKTTINEFFKYHGDHYKIHIDGHLIEEHAFVVACCNAAQYGNNAFIAPQASMQDGLIDVTIIHNFNLINGALLGARMLTKQIENDKHVSIYRGKHIVIQRSSEDIIHIDGEPQMMPRDLDITCVNKGLNVILSPWATKNL